MISTFIIDKGKYIVESASLSPFEEVYNAIESTSDPIINDHLVMASYFYHLPYWLDNPPIVCYLSHTLPMDESVIADFTTLGESHIVWPSLVPLQTH